MSVLGIDASNIQGGGGVTHLSELLRHADPLKFGINSVIVWGGQSLDALADRPWLAKVRLSRGKLRPWQQAIWNRWGIKRELANQRCDLVFSPGGTFVSQAIPYVSMSQNMLLYEANERRRFPFGWNRCRYNILRYRQTRSFRHATGIVFISNYAQQTIELQLPEVAAIPSTVIYHGSSDRFHPKQTNVDPRVGALKILYVSRVNFYKHQWNVVDAVEQLNAEGLDCRLRLVGGGNPRAIQKLNRHLKTAHNCEHVDELEYSQIDQEYRDADVFVFASTCENMPNILVEAMATGLPVVSSSYGPMPEILKDAGVYFDPVDVEGTREAIKKVLVDSSLRSELGSRAKEYSRQYSWNQCAQQTFQFFRDCIDLARQPLEPQPLESASIAGECLTE